MPCATLHLFALTCLAAVHAPHQAAPVPSLDIRHCLVVGPVTRGGRSAIHRDPVEALIVAGKWATPRAGDQVPGVDGAAGTWTEADTDKDGWFSGRALSGGYAFASVDCDRDRVMLLEAAGDTMAYVNGESRAGDPYEYGYVRLPVMLHRGSNELLFACGRGRLRARLVSPAAPLSLDPADATLPDLHAAQRTSSWGAVVLVNATEQPALGLAIEAAGPGLRTIRTRLPAVPALSVRKVGFRIEGRPLASAKECRITLRLTGAPSAAPVVLGLRVREPGQTYKQTFISGIDGCVQYYAVNPLRAGSAGSAVRDSSEQPALVLTLHGASVEAIGQADAYAPKSWAWLVAPTNRRPYGFDWEDWGREDAMEVLADAERALPHDPHCVYLTGHSMGGHGTWQLGATFPGRFAAIGPSAGWISFTSYLGGRSQEPATPVERILRRANASSDTLEMERNYAAEGVYILHGSADDNVPVTEARSMTTLLATFHHDFVYHEQPGAGHWWSVGDEPGARCVDWPPMFDLFARHRLPDDVDVRDVDFTTVDPAVSAQCHWLTISQQVRPLEPSRCEAHVDPLLRRFSIRTDNVASLALRPDAIAPGEPVTVEIDGQKLTDDERPAALVEPRRSEDTKDSRRRSEAAGPAADAPNTEHRTPNTALLTEHRTPNTDPNTEHRIPNTRALWLRRVAGRWTVSGPPRAGEKRPVRGGGFKRAFDHRPMLVYGTKGTPEENAWAVARARFDAETFWYRGNGAFDVVPDTAFDPSAEPDRSVVLYGNADTNAAWAALLGDSPVQVRRDGVFAGGHDISGADLACLFVRPRPRSAAALVGAVAGTGLAGCRLTERLPVFLSGAGLPDCLVLSADTLTAGARGIRAAGFFASDWSLGRDEDWAWQSAAGGE